MRINFVFLLILLSLLSCKTASNKRARESFQQPADATNPNALGLTWLGVGKTLVRKDEYIAGLERQALTKASPARVYVFSAVEKEELISELAKTKPSLRIKFTHSEALDGNEVHHHLEITKKEQTAVDDDTPPPFHTAEHVKATLPPPPPLIVARTVGENWPLTTTKYEKKIKEPLVLFVHPYTFNGSQGRFNTVLEPERVAVNELLADAAGKGHEVIYMSGGAQQVDKGIFPVQPTVTLRGEGQSYSPTHAQLLTTDITLIGGYIGCCHLVATTEVIRNHFRVSGNPLTIRYPLKAIVPKTSVDDAIKKIETAQKEGWRTFTGGDDVAIQPVLEIYVNGELRSRSGTGSGVVRFRITE